MHGPPRRISLDPARARPRGDALTARMIAALSERVGQPLAPATVTVDGSTRLEVEAAAADGSVFAQVIPHAGAFTSAHRNRVTANLFKLVWVATALFPDAQVALCVTPSVGPALAPHGWVRVAAQELGVRLLVFDPGSDSLRPAEEVLW
ncbi:hypothetical protein [Microbacterium aquimaris]|uniref:Uncharacterized protein n=1 Tax=Microbacterium aquimaris TaxID=459816 RepID=A0ABU5N511_9MICO|nr:hypothetical protein [Microbacterium aquimaris]MDZ8161158.1 hypothetical protein [Microbacterium aquimaris]